MATITGTIQEPNTVATQRVPVHFQLEETVSIGVITHPREWIETKTSAAGEFSIILVAGDYTVTCKGEEFKIAVPAGDDTYDISEIVTGGISFPSTIAGTFGFFQVSTMAELRTIKTKHFNKLTVVLGLTTINDGGGGTFWWDATGTAADDSYTIIRPNDFTSAGIWRRATDGLYSIKWFGGNGGGSVNNAAALAAGFSLADSLMVPPGTYRIASNVTIPAGKHLAFAKSAVLLIDGGVTLTVHGLISAPGALGTTAPDASALLDLTSTARGFLPPRMTTVQRDVITAPAEGLIIFNSTTGKLQIRAGAIWLDLQAGAGSFVSTGTGVPEGITTAQPGALYSDLTDPGHPVLWLKTSGGPPGPPTSTGWFPIIST